MQYAHRTLRLNEKVHDFSVRVRFSNPTARPGDSLFSTRTPRRDRQHIGFTPVSICWRTGGHELLGLVADARVGLGSGVGGSLSPPAFGLQVRAGRRLERLELDHLEPDFSMGLIAGPPQVPKAEGRAPRVVDERSERQVRIGR